MKDRIAEIVSDYTMLLETLVEVSDASTGDSGHPRGGYAESLIVKFIHHGASIFELFKGTHFTVHPKLTVDIVDFSSVQVLGRATLETFLMLHWLIIAPNDDIEAEYRFLLWQLVGQYTRLNAPNMGTQLEARAAIEEDVKRLTELLKNDFYKAHKPKHRKGILKEAAKCRIFNRTPWVQLIEDVGLNEIFEAMYKSYCDQAHTGYISASQLREPAPLEVQRQLCLATLRLVVLLKAKIITMCADVLPKSREAFDKHPNHDIVLNYANQACGI